MQLIAVSPVLGLGWCTWLRVAFVSHAGGKAFGMVVHVVAGCWVGSGWLSIRVGCSPHGTWHGAGYAEHGGLADKATWTVKWCGVEVMTHPAFD